MPRYFFHIYDGVDVHDTEGIILANAAAARAQAITSAGSMLKDLEGFEGSIEWRMTVVDEGGDSVCLLDFKAECV